MANIENMKDFIHLHVHSCYSVGDAMGSVREYIDKAVADGMKGMAVTDHRTDSRYNQQKGIESAHGWSAGNRKTDLCYNLQVPEYVYKGGRHSN